MMNDFEKLEIEETAESAPVVTYEPVEERAETSPSLQPATTRQRGWMLGTAAFVILADQLSKYLVEHYLPLGHSWEPIPGWGEWVRIVHTSNTGAAFGMFQGGSPIFAIVAIFVSLALLYYNFSLPAGYQTLRIVLGFQLGGALGNLIDRFRLGHVTDFIDVGPWYIFNIADASVVFGALALAWIMWHEQPPPGEETQNQPIVSNEQWETN